MTSLPIKKILRTKKIVNKNKSCLSNIQKVACLRTKYYQFNQRLQNKCKKYNVNFNLKLDSFYEFNEQLKESRKY